MKLFKDLNFGKIFFTEKVSEKYVKLNSNYETYKNPDSNSINLGTEPHSRFIANATDLSNGHLMFFVDTVEVYEF